MVEVNYIEYVNDEKARTEFMLVNYDYIDGNEYLSKIISEEFRCEIGEIVDGIWFRILPIRIDGVDCEMLWHEDIGNEIYCVNQSVDNNLVLKRCLDSAIPRLNECIKPK